MNRRTFHLFLLGLLTPMFADSSHQAVRADDGAAGESRGPWNLKTKTLGGTQFWSDELLYFDWRIQRNVLTNHCRLLDDKNVRQAYGSFENCQRTLNRIRQSAKMPPMTGRVVIALHGTGRSRRSMSPIVDYLAGNGFTALNASYASTRSTIDQHAVSLARIVANLDPGVTEVHFVAHSMGNLVIRHFLADQMRTSPNGRIDPRIARIVMLGPPNQGTQLGRRFQKNQLFRVLWGASGREMASWEKLEQRLAVPSCQFGIIAGGKGDAQGSNPLVSGDDDFVVSVDETKLSGATDFLVVPVLHTFLMNDPRVHESTLRFLREGCFLSQHQRTPLR